MSAQDQARVLMMRHHHLIKNRQQSLLARSAAEVGIDVTDDYANTQGTPCASCRVTYDRSHSTMS